MKKILVVCTTDSMIWNFLVPHIKELESKGFYIECACSRTGSFFDDLIKTHGIKMNEIAFERSPYKVKNLKAFNNLVRIIKEKKFDTVFCHEPVGGAIGRLAGHKCGCKVIYMAHGFHFYKGAPKLRKIYYIVEKMLSRYTDVLVTINQEDYEVSKGFYAKKCIKTNGIGVDTKKFVFNNDDSAFIKKELGIPDNAVVVLSVGELIKRKNHEVVIKAINKLRTQNVYYVIAGDGEIKEELKTLISKLGLYHKVFLLGYRTDISKLCNSADIFVLPSIHEGLSVALMEAMGCGKPVVGSRIRGNIDLIDENKGGYLVDTYDIEGFAKSIYTLLCDSNLRMKMGQYNVEKVKGFDTELVKKQILALFEEDKL